MGPVGPPVATFLRLWEQRGPGAGGTIRGSRTTGVGCHSGRRENGTEMEAEAVAPRSLGHALPRPRCSLSLCTDFCHGH